MVKNRYIIYKVIDGYPVVAHGYTKKAEAISKADKYATDGIQAHVCDLNTYTTIYRNTVSEKAQS
jgi:hypothetical protein